MIIYSLKWLHPRFVYPSFAIARDEIEYSNDAIYNTAVFGVIWINYLLGVCRLQE